MGNLKLTLAVHAHSSDPDDPMTSENLHIRERHLLVFNYKKNRYVELNADIVTLGRDSSKDVRIKHNLISREHATFLRIPTSDFNKYEYRIIDGGPNTKCSANGVYVNDRRTYLHILQHGDVINFSTLYEAIYLKVELSEKHLKQYLALLSHIKQFDQENRNNIATLTRVFCKAKLPEITSGTLQALIGA